MISPLDKILESPLDKIVEDPDGAKRRRSPRIPVGSLARTASMVTWNLEKIRTELHNPPPPWLPIEAKMSKYAPYFPGGKNKFSVASQKDKDVTFEKEKPVVEVRSAVDLDEVQKLRDRVETLEIASRDYDVLLEQANTRSNYLTDILRQDRTIEAATKRISMKPDVFATIGVSADIVPEMYSNIARNMDKMSAMEQQVGECLRDKNRAERKVATLEADLLFARHERSRLEGVRRLTRGFTGMRASKVFREKPSDDVGPQGTPEANQNLALTNARLRAEVAFVYQKWQECERALRKQGKRRARNCDDLCV